MIDLAMRTKEAMVSGNESPIREVSFFPKNEDVLLTNRPVPLSNSKKFKILTSFWNACHEGFFIFDKNLNCIQINRSALRTMRKTNWNVTGKNILEIFPDLKDTKNYNIFLNILKTGKPFALKEMPNPQRKGHYIHIFAFKVLDGLGIVISDITKSYHNEINLKNSFRLLQNLSTHSQILREEESKRIARELHDEMSPVLTTFKMDLYWLESKLQDEFKQKTAVKKKIFEMADLVDKTISSLRKICSELRPALLDDLGLFDAMEWQIQQIQARFPLKCRLAIDCNGMVFSPDLSICIFRIFKEALTNILRHANALKAFVSLKQIPSENALVLKIHDNGRGIRPKEISSLESFGLIGIKERLHAYDGQMKIRGIPDKGTTLTIKIPMGPKPPKNADVKS
ncbi:MAG: sensor histidine kinase [Candidatus Aminicenantales bacterium]